MLNDHAKTISTIRRLTDARILAGAFGPAGGDWRGILDLLRAEGVALPTDPGEALGFALALNAELNTGDWPEHPALLAVLWEMPKVIERTTDREVLARYVQACPDECAHAEPLALDWLMIPADHRVELVARLAA